MCEFLDRALINCDVWDCVFKIRFDTRELILIHYSDHVPLFIRRWPVKKVTFTRNVHVESACIPERFLFQAHIFSFVFTIFLNVISLNRNSWIQFKNSKFKIQWDSSFSLRDSNSFWAVRWFKALTLVLFVYFLFSCFFHATHHASTRLIREINDTRRRTFFQTNALMFVWICFAIVVHRFVTSAFWHHYIPNDLFKKTNCWKVFHR